MSKALWRILLVITGFLAFWWVIQASFALWEYNRLAVEVPAKVTQWDVLQKGSAFAIHVHYRYTYNGKNFTGTTTLAKPYYLNKETANRQIQKMEGMHWMVWLDPKTPKYSSLEKKFPLRDSFYAFCLLGIFLYFLFLKIHLELLSRRM